MIGRGGYLHVCGIDICKKKNVAYDVMHVDIIWFMMSRFLKPQVTVTVISRACSGRSTGAYNFAARLNGRTKRSSPSIPVLATAVPPTLHVGAIDMWCSPHAQISRSHR